MYTRYTLHNLCSWFYVKVHLKWLVISNLSSDIQSQYRNNVLDMCVQRFNGEKKKKKKLAHKTELKPNQIS